MKHAPAPQDHQASPASTASAAPSATAATAAVAAASKSPLLGTSARSARAGFFRGPSTGAAPTLIESLYSSVRGSASQGSPSPSPGGVAPGLSSAESGYEAVRRGALGAKGYGKAPAPGFPRLSRSHGWTGASAPMQSKARELSDRKLSPGDFDHLALLRGLSIRRAARVSVHQFSRSKVSALLTPQTAWDSYHMELRGGLIAFFLDDRHSWGSPTRSQNHRKELGETSSFARDSHLLRSASSGSLGVGVSKVSAIGSEARRMSGRFRGRQRAQSTVELKDSSTSFEASGLSDNKNINVGNGDAYNGAVVGGGELVACDSDRQLVGLFSAIGCGIKRKKGAILKLKKGSQYGPLALRFNSEEECGEWEQELRALACTSFLSLSDFDVVAAIGKGASAKVFLVTNRASGRKLALKVINKKMMYVDPTTFRHVVDERLALEIVRDEPYFVQLLHAFQTRNALYLATDFCEGGDMHQLLRKRGALPLHAARLLVAQLVLALESLHARHIVYRDLKPENVLFDSDGCARLADLGLCKKLSRGSRNPLTSTVCGTFSYAAPEMLALQDYGFGVDFWSLGVLLYQAVHTTLPFNEAQLKALGTTIRERSKSQSVWNSSTSALPVTVAEGGELLALMDDQHDSFGADNADSAHGEERSDDASDCLSDKGHAKSPAAGVRAALAGDDRSTAEDLDESTGLPRLSFKPECDPYYCQLVHGLLTAEPQARLGCGLEGTLAVKSHPFFASIDWRDLAARKVVNVDLRSYVNSTENGGAQDDLRHFDTEVTGDIHVDEDEDDLAYGDIGLWPPSKAKLLLEEDPMLAGFSFSDDVFGNHVGSRSST